MLELFIPVVGTVGALVLGWYLNERSKRAFEAYKRREDRYKLLISSAEGFYVHSVDAELKQKFIRNLSMCWLYCTDEIIKKGYKFLDTVSVGKSYTDDEKEDALSDLVCTMRKDLIERKLLKNTELTKDDFKHLRST